MVCSQTGMTASAGPRADHPHPPPPPPRLCLVNPLPLRVQVPAFPCFPDALHGFITFYA